MQCLNYRLACNYSVQLVHRISFNAIMVSALRRPNAAIAEWTALINLMSADVVSIDFIVVESTFFISV